MNRSYLLLAGLVDYISFTNTFDPNGNLTSLSYQGPSPYSALGVPTKTEQYKYRP